LLHFLKQLDSVHGIQTINVNKK